MPSTQFGTGPHCSKVHPIKYKDNALLTFLYALTEYGESRIAFLEEENSAIFATQSSKMFILKSNCAVSFVNNIVPETNNFRISVLLKLRKYSEKVL